MESKHCLKFNYHGEIEHVECDIGTIYEDILDMLLQRYSIPADYKNAIMLSNENGYIFGKQLFEYFLLLFPRPKLVFNVRVNWSQLKKDVQAYMTPKLRIKNDNNAAQKRTVSERDDAFVAAVPVRRQNCFLGILPNGALNEMMAVVNNQLQYEKRLKISTIMRHDNSNLISRMTTTPRNSLKRALRI